MNRNASYRQYYYGESYIEDFLYWRGIQYCKNKLYMV